MANEEDKVRLHRWGLIGIKIALFGGLQLPAMFWLIPWLADSGSTHPSLFYQILEGVFGVLGFLSLPVLLICEISALFYGVLAWRFLTGKLAIVAVFAAIGGNFLYLAHIWGEGFI